MSRRRQATRRPVQSDAKFNSTLVSRLVNTVMNCGKKSTGARTWVYIYNQNGQMLSQICWITSPNSLQRLLYAPKPGEPAPDQLIVVLEDKQTNKSYKSNAVSVK